MNTRKLASPNAYSGGWPLLLLAGILAVLFWKSFLPGYVQFSNDGPLGQQNAAWIKLPGAFAGSWGDLNLVGTSGGSYPLGMSAMIYWVLGPVGLSKFYAPIALFILGLGAWTFLRQLKLSPLAAILGGLAAALNSSYFSRACWGIGGHPIAVGMDFFALALVVSNSPQTRVLTRWVRLALAGLAVGVGVMEGADLGAILSLFVAAFVFFRELVKDFVSLSKIERIIILCCVNGASCLLLVSALVFGSGIGFGTLKLCLLVIVLLTATATLNWSLMRSLNPLSKIERIASLGLTNIGFLLLLIFGILHSFGFFFFAILLIVTIALNWALLYYHLFVNRCGLGIVRLMVISLFAGFIALQTIMALVGTNITGVVGTGQDKETKAAGWDKATEWSLPKKETLGFIVPGLFGYRMDTPKDMTTSLQDAYQGGGYWGGEGRTPEIDRYFDSGSTGPQPPGIMRFNGDGHYLGILVALFAAFAIAQSLRRKNSPFTLMQKKFVWFWTGVMIIALLLAWGRFAPFYQFFYALPYVSTIRNPVKFIFVFSWAVVILSGYGVHILSRRYLEIPAGNKTSNFDRKWIMACAAAAAASLLAWLMYSAQKNGLIHYLQTVGFSDESSAKQIADFSIGQAGWFVFIFALAAGIFALIVAGKLSGPRAKLGGILLGALLVLDLGRADLPFIISQDYVQKYASNPIIDLLKDKPYEHRVANLPFRVPDQFQLFEELYSIEWMQHHFPYYNIQSLDIVQMARAATDWAAFESALAPDNTEATAYLIPRRWQLTNTRYLLGPAGYLDVLNTQLDPGQNRFSIVQRFTIGLKPGVSEFHQRLEELTAIPATNGDYALFEFTGALPRAKLYSNWQTSTNDEATLKTLADKNFDPLQTVLIDTPQKDLPDMATKQNSGSVEFKSYSTKDIMFDANATAPSILLLNDKYDPHWSVTVDGKPAELLRCNFIMRGVYLPPGAHTVEFQFSLPHRPLYVTIAAIAVGIILLGFLIVLQRRKPANTA